MSLFAAYPGGLERGGYQAAFDEMFAETGTLTARPHYHALYERVKGLSDDEFNRRVSLADATLMNQGITFTVYGDALGVERTFPVDLIPRILPADEWDRIERGLTQRINALNLFLRDLYSEDPQILKDNIIPRDLIETASHYRRAFVGCPAPKNLYVHICGTDLIRDHAGDWCVLEDNLRTPSGVSYVLENRLILTRVFPQLFAAQNIRPVDHYTTALLGNLRALSSRSQCTVVLLTPGVYNSAYFEHAFLAQQMGIELVQGRDLFVESDNCVYMKTTHGAQRVDVIYRRIDDDFLDPEIFRKESSLGVPGLMRAYAAGNVALANTVGTGVADDKVVYRYVPEIIRYYLDQDAILPNVPTYCAWEEKEREYILGNLDKLVVKSANESGGYGMLIGPQATAFERSQFADKIRAEPRNFLAQPVVELSTAPCYVAGKGIVPRRVDLRPYILSGPSGVTIIPGGLTRVALKEGSYVVNSSQGGGSKDTWVLDKVRPPMRQSLGGMTQSLGEGGMSQQMGEMRQSLGQPPGLAAEEPPMDAALRDEPETKPNQTQSQTQGGMHS
ncbi:MAG: circularly permuted type 2 ATP-grasp protein [Cytophagales bacterium]|nr:circularly permuted type 2 ATP-grasp protein [Armatimonadota bacterium]